MHSTHIIYNAWRYCLENNLMSSTNRRVMLSDQTCPAPKVPAMQLHQSGAIGNTTPKGMRVGPPNPFVSDYSQLLNQAAPCTYRTFGDPFLDLNLTAMSCCSATLSMVYPHLAHTVTSHLRKDGGRSIHFLFQSVSILTSIVSELQELCDVTHLAFGDTSLAPRVLSVWGP